MTLTGIRRTGGASGGGTEKTDAVGGTGGTDAGGMTEVTEAVEGTDATDAEGWRGATGAGATDADALRRSNSMK